VPADLPPKRPYLVRALHEWMTDAGLTPHLVVDATRPGVQVPEKFVTDGRIVLNVSYGATQGLVMGNTTVAFNARFGGTPHHIEVPLPAVLGIYARESGEGLVFPTDEYPDGGTPPPPAGEPPPAPSTPPAGRPALKVVK
jgi:stringent starvation protein B